MKVLLLIGILITCFTPDAFAQAEDELDLGKRNITKIDHNTDVLKNAPLDTASLSLYDNDLLVVDKKSFQRFKSLQKLDLDGNRRLNFPKDGSEFLELKSLTDLECFRCGVDKIYNRSLQGMPRLQKINLTSNRIEEIEVNAFYANKNLYWVDLQSNQLRRVPNEMLTPLVSIREINLSLNKELAPEDSEPFLISRVLEKLNCDECGFVTIQEYTFAKLPKLKELYLRSNKISQIHGLAFSQVTLTTLMLERNALTIVDLRFLNMVGVDICLDNNTNELACFLKDLPNMEKYDCYNSSTDVECLAPTTTQISTTSSTDVTNSFTDTTITPVDSRMSIMTTNHPETFAKTETTTASTPSTPSVEIVEGISDAYIGGYLTLIYLAQIVTFILLVGVWLKLKKYDTDPDVDMYAENILNPNPIYKAIY